MYYTTFRLMLPPVQANTYCLQFAYHMFGHHIGTLAVYTMSLSGELSQSAVWRQSGEKGDVWLTTRTDIVVTQDEQIAFVGVRATEYSGDIGLDTMELRAGAC